MWQRTKPCALRIWPQIRVANETKAEQATFMVLHEGRIYFEGVYRRCYEVLGRTDLSMQSQARANAASSVGATTLSIPGT